MYFACSLRHLHRHQNALQPRRQRARQLRLHTHVLYRVKTHTPCTPTATPEAATLQGTQHLPEALEVLVPDPHGLLAAGWMCNGLEVGKGGAIVELVELGGYVSHYLIYREILTKLIKV